MAVSAESPYNLALTPNLLFATYVVAVLLPIVVFSDTSKGIFSYWEQMNYQHGYFVLPIAFLMAFNQRDKLSSIRPSVGPLFVLLIAIFAWLFSKFSLIQIGEHLSLWVMIFACVWAYQGWQNFRHFAYPTAYLFLAIPIGDNNVPILIDITSFLSSQALILFSVPTYIEGNIIHLPGGTFEVAEACSGFKFLMTGMTIGLYVAYEQYKSLLRRTVFIAVLLTFCLLLNSLRAFLIMYIASATNMEYLAHDHVWFGWVLYAVGLIFIIGISTRYEALRAHAN